MTRRSFFASIAAFVAGCFVTRQAKCGKSQAILRQLVRYGESHPDAKFIVTRINCRPIGDHEMEFFLEYVNESSWPVA